MLQYEIIDVSEGTDLNKSYKSKECMICHSWYFIDIGYKYEPHVCNGCHDLSMMVYDLNDFMILSIIKALIIDAMYLIRVKVTQLTC